jgi:hypothetical protein
MLFLAGFLTPKVLEMHIAVRPLPLIFRLPGNPENRYHPGQRVIRGFPRIKNNTKLGRL